MATSPYFVDPGEFEDEPDFEQPLRTGEGRNKPRRSHGSSSASSASSSDADSVGSFESHESHDPLFIQTDYGISSTKMMPSSKGRVLKTVLATCCVFAAGIATGTLVGNLTGSNDNNGDPEPRDGPPIIDWEMANYEDMILTLREEQEDPSFDPTFEHKKEVQLAEESALALSEEDRNPEALLDESLGSETTSLVYDRNLMGMGDFLEPLSCNVDLESQPCSSFLALLSSGVAVDPLVIPCGECYEVDITDGSTIELPDGLRIEGKLYFPSSASLTIRTKFVWVLGLLEMDTPAVGNLVKISLYGDEAQTFIANDPNSDVCGGTGCSLSSKVIGVVGGQLKIQGTEPECPSWEKLTAVVGDGDPRPLTGENLPCDYQTGDCWTTNVVELDGTCTYSDGHTQNLGKYTVQCPVKNPGVHVGSGTGAGITLTSVSAGIETPFVYPTDGTNSLSLVRGVGSGRAGHTDRFGKCVLWARLEETITVPSGYDGPLTFTSVDTNGVGNPAAGQTFNVNKVHHWAWKGKTMYFFPENESVDDCAQTASEFNAMFPTSYGIEVSKRSVAPIGQQVTASNGVHHWSWSSNRLYFFPDEDVDAINAKFKKGYQLEVGYLDKKDYYEIQVSPEAAGCWKPDTELLLTSHTRNQDDQQVRTIESSDSATGIIRLTAPIDKPISLQDHSDFAVEVASLNRRILFEADDNANDEFIGGHLVVHHTPAPQHIEGVEIRNFGQQGVLGKYPLHFHMCGDSPYSLVKKNVVRDSNQRCYVIHLTNQVSLEENVAYDAFGHCYFIEDGAETGNIFTKNLGSGIKIMPTDRVAMLEAKSGRDETDDAPHGFNGASVFWISNPQNYFYGNVAAGGQKNGYWFETRSDRRYMDLGAFEDNEVHSSGVQAFSVYAPGWRPSGISTIKNLKAYRNPSWGAFLHVTRNLVFEGGLFADNGDRAVHIDRGDDIVFDGTTFIGKTEHADRYCPGSLKTGIGFNPTRLSETILGDVAGVTKGTTVRNVQFKNWTPEATECAVSRPMHFYYGQSFIKAMNGLHTFHNLQVDDNTSPIVNACMPGSNIDDVSIEIVNDTLNAFTGSPGFLVSPKLVPFIVAQGSSCTPYDNSCLQLCENTCPRTITVMAGNAAFDDDIVMIVSDGQTELTVTKDVRGHPGPEPVGNRFASAYTVVLPKGNFSARFERLSAPGVKVWPGYATAIFEASPSSCGNFIVEGEFQIEKPTSGRPECDGLITNGNFEHQGVFAGEVWGIHGWSGFYRGIQFVAGGGVDGSGALATTGTTSSGHNPSQFLDATCLDEGDVYEVEVHYQVVDRSLGDVAADADNLPFVRVRIDTYDASIKGFTGIQWNTVSTTTSQNDGNGSWGTITGTWTVTAAEAASDRINFHIAGGQDYIKIDNVSATKQGARRHQRYLR